MTDQSPWNRFTERNEVHILGEFKNEYGERYVVYRMKGGDTPYFTGDEVDWKPREPLLWNSFTFNEEERRHIARILWPTMHEQIETVLAEAQKNTADPAT